MGAAPGVWEQVLKALDRHGRAAMVTLAATRGSSPREAGARMIVNPDGTFTGTIGGGTLEWKAIAMAQAALGNPAAPKAEARGFALGPELGQCCGGNVDVIVEIIEGPARDAVADFARREAAGHLVTRGRLSAEKGVVREIASAEMEPGAASFIGGLLTEGFGDMRRPLYLFGAGHVGKALVLALAPLPFAVTWLDTRSDAFPGFAPGNTVVRTFADPVAELAAAPDNAFVLVMTHSHPLDLAIVNVALVGRFPYVGVIGSKSKRARFTRMLAAAGVPRDRIAALVCPIGIPGIHSKAPAVIAAATVAQMLARDEELRSAALPPERLNEPLRRIG
jgi:xanthine dehydrogenase accessory factor